MNWLGIFIHRPVATSLLTIAIALPGILAFQHLPRAPLPQVDYPTVNVSANLPGASPETMAATVATPLERVFGRIAGINEMTSTSTQGTTRISLQFDLDRDSDGAVRDVQAAINAASAMLPDDLPSQPGYRRFNAGAAPILAMSLTSPTHTQEQLYDLAFSILSQKISQVNGVGQVVINGSALRAVRIEINPTALNQYGINLEQVRAAVSASNRNRPKGSLQDERNRWQIEVNGEAKQASEYRDLIVAWRNGAPVRLSQIATVKDSLQELRNAGSANGIPSVMVVTFNQPGANVIATVDQILGMLPALKNLLPSAVELNVVIDRSTTIRKSLNEIQKKLLISVALVVLVTYVFLRSGRATLIPIIAIPVSLLGTLGVIYLCGFSLNNLSLMALIISAGFVVDDAIVVVENVTHHLEQGMEPFKAALKGVQEVGFTVITMSLSLVAVFIPLLFMDGILGRLFREFAVTLSVAVLISMVVSLTATPMLCAQFLRKTQNDAQGGFVGRWLEYAINQLISIYRVTLDFALRHSRLTLALLAAVIALNAYLYVVIPKGFFPQQDTGRVQGFFQGDQSLSFKAMRERIDKLMLIVSEDPNFHTYYEYTGGAGGGQTNTGTMFGSLVPRADREFSAAEIVAKLRPRLMQVPGATLMLTAQQELSIGARAGSAQYQFTLLASTLAELRDIAPRLRGVMSRLPELTDVNSDFQTQGLQVQLTIDRDAAARYGVTSSQIESALNNAFSQRLISTIYEPLNQYNVVLTLQPQFTSGPEALEQIFINTPTGKIPLSAVSDWQTRSAPLAVNHQDQFVAATISFNLAEGVSLEQGVKVIEEAFASINPPENIQGKFSGAAKMFQESLASQPWLILTALISVYIVLGILYESTIHPLTILSTLPSAGVGALLALMAFDSEFSIIALIGVILLIGLVMKNAIIMIDCALQAEREQKLSPGQAIRYACLLRFRPIVMTTLAAMFGALPLALGIGDGSELRKPLGISIVGGLLFSQVLTLYTTPVIYLYLDRLRQWTIRRWQHGFKPALPAQA